MNRKECKERIKKLIVIVGKSNMEIEDIEEIVGLLSLLYDNIIESLDE